MKSPLIPIDILSIYKNSFGDQVPVPRRMALCTPDTYIALLNISKVVAERGGKLILSDLFRSYDMQMQAHNDYVSGKKRAFSPSPGGSFHEAGRAFDMDLRAINMSLGAFWEIAAKYGVRPIINLPKINASEAWHFDCRGSHQIIYDYYNARRANNMKPYTASAASAILGSGIKVDFFSTNQVQASIQSSLIRLGKEIGNLDGQIGRKSMRGLEELGLIYNSENPGNTLNNLENLIQLQYPQEFSVPRIHL